MPGSELGCALSREVRTNGGGRGPRPAAPVTRELGPERVSPEAGSALPLPQRTGTPSISGVVVRTHSDAPFAEKRDSSLAVGRSQ